MSSSRERDFSSATSRAIFVLGSSPLPDDAAAAAAPAAPAPMAPAFFRARLRRSVPRTTMGVPLELAVFVSSADGEFATTYDNMIST